MEFISTIINWLSAGQWATIAGALATIIGVIVARTPTEKDDSFFRRIMGLFGKDKLTKDE